MHEERYELSAETASLVNAARREGRRIIAAGTTTVRVLESAARERETGRRGDGETATTVRVLESAALGNENMLVAGAGRTGIFIYPPYRFRMVDVLLTNFHLPRSTLVMLASAFAAPGELRGRELLLSAYAEAVRQQYRFFSYGDAMLIDHRPPLFPVPGLRRVNDQQRHPVKRRQQAQNFSQVRRDVAGQNQGGNRANEHGEVQEEQRIHQIAASLADGLYPLFIMARQQAETIGQSPAQFARPQHGQVKGGEPIPYPAEGFVKSGSAFEVLNELG